DPDVPAPSGHYYCSGGSHVPGSCPQLLGPWRGLRRRRRVLDLETGEAWSAAVIENSRDAGLEELPGEPDGKRWLAVWPEGSDDAYATWMISSPRSTIPRSPIGCAPPSTGGARSVASATCSIAGRRRPHAGTRSPTTVRSAGGAPGSQTPAIGPCLVPRTGADGFHRRLGAVLVECEFALESRRNTG